MIDHITRTTVRHRRLISLICLPVIFLFLLPLYFSVARANNHSADIAGQESSPASGSEFVYVSSNDYATTFTIRRGHCSINWIVRKTEADVIKHSAVCDMPLSSQIPLLVQLGRSFFSRRVNTSPAQKLFWGTLENNDTSSENEMSFRLALAAAKTPAWNAKMGKPQKDELYSFVKDLANREMIYPELKDVFTHLDKNITLCAIEKVRVMEAQKLPIYEKLKNHGVQPKDKLPFDFMAWFSVSEYNIKN